MIKLLNGDCSEVLKEFPDNHFDSVVTDPPYGISFMGKKWDYDVPTVEVWAECLRVLKPGGHLLAFAGTRTQHRMAVNIEDAGFEIRDMIAWVYGSGFPKSHNLKDDWDGWGTALKPALEPITLARKPLTGTVAANVIQHGTGALNVDGCRVGTTENLNGGAYCSGGNRQTLAGDERQGAAAGMFQPGKTVDADFTQPAGRWPANLIHDGSDEVVELFPQAGSDSRSAARFFYCAKTSKKERGEGNNHPAVKPLQLMQYLCRLVTPPGGTVLDPFMGSGSTVLAAKNENFNAVGIELDPEYIKIAQSRLE